MESRHQDWFDDNAADIHSLIHDKMMLCCGIQLLEHILYPCDSAAQAKVDGEQMVGVEGGSDTELCQY